MRSKTTFSGASLNRPERQRRNALAPFAVALALLVTVAVSLEFGGALSDASVVHAQEAPSTVPEIARLEFKFETPRMVTIYPGDGRDVRSDGIPRSGRAYWYLPYTLVNKGKKPGTYFVTMRATSEKNKKYSDLALPFVEKKIEKIERRELQSKVDLVKKSAKIGDKNWREYQQYPPNEMRHCVAIFNPLDREADRVVISVHGLVDDIEIEDLGNDRFRFTERVLQITFARPGDEFYSSLDKFELVGQKWTKVVTETPVKK